MRAKIYVDVMTKAHPIEEVVDVLEISKIPQKNKRGMYTYRKSNTEEDIRILRLFKKGIRVAKVKYADGSIQDNVWVGVNDIIE